MVLKRAAIIACAVIALVILYMIGDHMERPCRTFNYALGSPQARAEKMFRDYYAKVPFVGGSRQGYEEMLAYPVEVELMDDGWHAYYYSSRCNLFGQYKTGMLGGTTLLFDKKSLNLLKVRHGQ